MAIINSDGKKTSKNKLIEVKVEEVEVKKVRAATIYTPARWLI